MEGLAEVPDSTAGLLASHLNHPDIVEEDDDGSSVPPCEAPRPALCPRPTRWFHSLPDGMHCPAVGCPPQSLGQFRRTPITFNPPQPQPGRSPDLLLRDFMPRAAAVPTNRHAAARLFLTAKGNADWDDQATLKVIERIDVNTVATPDANSLVMQVRARSMGEVDKQGAFRSNLSTHTFEVKMHRNGKQWLIDRFPDELLVDREAFMATYESQSIYYLDVTGSRVVPDPRWLYAPR
ncbi:MAG: hypothetical protein U1U88_001985 [Lawsonella clevelandensis]